MQDLVVFRLDVVRVQVGDSRDIRVRDLTVVALVVVVCEDLPVELALHVPGVVKGVVLEVVELVAGLRVDALKVVFPGDLGLLASVQVDPDETIAVNVDVDGLEAVALVATDVLILVLHDDVFVASGAVANHVASVGDAVLVRREEPLP